jgi:hypothetical protein
MAVRVALSETELIKQAKEELEDEGIDFDALQNKDKIERSKNIFLIKNLPPDVVISDLESLFSMFDGAEIILPQNKTIGLVKFEDSTVARTAFRKLAYSNL